MVTLVAVERVPRNGRNPRGNARKFPYATRLQDKRDSLKIWAKQIKDLRRHCRVRRVYKRCVAGGEAGVVTRSASSSRPGALERRGARGGRWRRERTPPARPLSLVERCPTGNVAPTADRETNSDHVFRGKDFQVHVPQQRRRRHRHGQHRVQRRPECSLQAGGLAYVSCAVKWMLVNSDRHICCIFQDKIRLLHDDLESERELRQRVSSTVRNVISNAHRLTGRAGVGGALIIPPARLLLT